jgi:hypothetical protein
VIIEDLDIEVHLAEEGHIISKERKTQSRFVHGINLVVARNYSDNPKEDWRHMETLGKTRQRVTTQTTTQDLLQMVSKRK